MIDLQDELLKDMEAVRQIPVVPTMLEIICQTTGMGFAAIARVTTDRWVACSVRDEVEFGLKEGGELKIETTLCNEIRDSREPVIIENVEKDPQYKHHHTPKIYGLQSYISFPILLQDGTFFGTLCAIDSKPARLKTPKVIDTFKMFTELLAFHLKSQDLLERSYKATLDLQTKNRRLSRANYDLDTIVYSASHDLKSPISNLEGLVHALSGILDQENPDREKANKIIKMMKASLGHLGITINDLTTIVEVGNNGESENYEAIDIFEIVKNVKQDLNKQIAESNAKIEVSSDDKLVINYSKKNFRSIIYNFLSNAIKYRSPDRCPEVLLKLYKTDGRIKLTITDNGLGIPSEKQEKLFTLFNRLHKHVEGSGIGLYLVKRIVENAKGQIEVKSTVNKGTTFTIIF